MSRRSSRNADFYDTIEYIGPRPQKPQKKRRFFGGWVILAIAAGISYLFVQQFLPTVRAEQQGISVQNIELAIAGLEKVGNPGSKLAAAALGQVRKPGVYDDSYYKIDYPNGDIPPEKGKAEDVVIRAYRTALGVDLQQLVHEDMEKSFREYEQPSRSGGLDPNIDHRRASNLKRFFERNGESLNVSRNLEGYQPGDIVVLARPGSRNNSGQIDMHIGVIAPGPENKAGGGVWLVHNLDSGVKWEDTLLSYQIIGHYRYSR